MKNKTVLVAAFLAATSFASAAQEAEQLEFIMVDLGVYQDASYANAPPGIDTANFELIVSLQEDRGFYAGQLVVNWESPPGLHADQIGTKAIVDNYHIFSEDSAYIEEPFTIGVATSSHPPNLEETIAYAMAIAYGQAGILLVDSTGETTSAAASGNAWHYS